MDGFDYADDLLSEIEAIERGEERFLREAADAAVRDGKEPFDFEVFRKLYWRQGIMRSGMDSLAAEDAADSYERRTPPKMSISHDASNPPRKRSP